MPDIRRQLNNDFALARYNADGSLDTTFDADGKVTTDFVGGERDDAAMAVAVQADGKIVVAGYTTAPATLDFALARYNADGSLDTTFDGDGKAHHRPSASVATTVPTASAVQADGKIVVAGYLDPAGGDHDFALARYNADGSLDTTFDADGKLTTDFIGRR